MCRMSPPRKPIPKNVAIYEQKYALYKKELATYGEKDKFNRKDAEGFINIFCENRFYLY